MKKYNMYVKEIVDEFPGHFTRDDIVRQIRIREAESGHEDPGYKPIREIVDRMVDNGEIEEYTSLLTLDKRCYSKNPKSFFLDR